MSIHLDTIRKPRMLQAEDLMDSLKPHTAALDAYLDQQVQCFEPEIQDMVQYTLSHRGKRIRPMLVFYSGWSHDAFVSPKLVRIAAALEMIHLATLVHDDVLDEASLRRNCRTVNCQYGAKEAILLGDALFAHSLKLSADFPTVDVCQRVTECARNVCTGEIIQTLRRGDQDFSRQRYYRVIGLKTAELFSVACELGAKVGGYSSAYVRDLIDFGRFLGIAYQIFDDLADVWGTEVKIGKTLGTDLLTQKWTLPLIAYFESLTTTEQQEFLRLMEDGPMPALGSMKASMSAQGVFEKVITEFQANIKAAEASLSLHVLEASYPYLSGFKELIKNELHKLNS